MAGTLKVPPCTFFSDPPILFKIWYRKLAPQQKRGGGRADTVVTLGNAFKLRKTNCF